MKRQTVKETKKTIKKIQVLGMSQLIEVMENDVG